jgi:hypothetical protein
VVAEDYDNINNNYLSSMYKNNGKIYEDYFRKGDLNTLNYIYSSMSIQI